MLRVSIITQYDTCVERDMTPQGPALIRRALQY